MELKTAEERWNEEHVHGIQDDLDVVKKATDKLSDKEPDCPTEVESQLEEEHNKLPKISLSDRKCVETKVDKAENDLSVPVKAAEALVAMPLDNVSRLAPESIEDRMIRGD